MLDSTAAVAAEHRGKNARQLLEAVVLEAGDEGIALSVLTVLELAHGITRADTAERRERRQRFLDDLLTGVPICRRRDVAHILFVNNKRDMQKRLCFSRARQG